MKKIKRTTITFCTTFCLILMICLTAFAASMDKSDWYWNSWVGYSNTTKGGIVYAVQKILNSSGNNVTNDGYYGNQTYTATKSYQKTYGLTQDGVIGKNTWKNVQNHTIYTGSNGSIDCFITFYSSNKPVAYFERDYINGWCISTNNEETGTFYRCNEIRFYVRTVVPL